MNTSLTIDLFRASAPSSVTLTIVAGQSDSLARHSEQLLDDLVIAVRIQRGATMPLSERLADLNRAIFRHLAGQQEVFGRLANDHNSRVTDIKRAVMAAWFRPRNRPIYLVSASADGLGR